MRNDTTIIYDSSAAFVNALYDPGDVVLVRHIETWSENGQKSVTPGGPSQMSRMRCATTPKRAPAAALRQRRLPARIATSTRIVRMLWG